jgi:aspartate/methionine/tyrosine aminotransferase
MLSNRVKILADSKTLMMANRARELRANGIKVYDFTIGEPDYPTPENIKIFAKKAIDLNLTKYTSNEGTLNLRKAIQNDLKKVFNLEYDISEIIVSTGAKQSIFNAIHSLVDPDDEVIIPAPYYVSYPEIVSLANGKSVIIDSTEESGFKISADDLEKAITPKTKMFIINNPCNPTGAAYSKKELMELAEVLVNKNIFVLSDEIYYKLVYDNMQFASFASLSEEIKKKTILINGASKTYSMTGWRIGYGAGDRDVISAMNKIQSHCTSGACSIAQEAAYEAYTGPQESVKIMVDEFHKRRNVLHEMLSSFPGISCFKAQGAFYLFPNISHYFKYEYKGKKLKNSNDFAEFLLDYSHIAVVPGGASGNDNCVRLSYATSMENIKTGAEKIGEALSDLRNGSFKN